MLCEQFAQSACQVSPFHNNIKNTQTCTNNFCSNSWIMCSISGSNCGIILPPAFAASMFAGPSTSSVLNVLSPSILALDCVVYTSILAVGCVVLWVMQRAVLWVMQRAVLWGMQRAVLWGCVVYTSELAVDTGRNIHHKSMRGMSCF